MDGTVYLIDDDTTARESIATLTRTMGLATESYSSAEAFLESQRQVGPGCVITDLRLQGMSGLELLERLSSTQDPLPVILLTAYARTPITVRAIRGGAINVLDKPCDEDRLWDAIREALAEESKRRQERTHRRDLESRFASLTPQEAGVLEMMISGATNRQIATRLEVSTRTIEARRHQIFLKTRTQTVADLVRLAERLRGTDQGAEDASRRHRPYLG